MKKVSKEFFVKDGKKYKSIGNEFVGFPCDGIWLVSDGTQNCIIQLSDIKDSHPKLFIVKANHRKHLENFIMNKIKEKHHYSVNDIINYVCEYIAENLEQ